MKSDDLTKHTLFLRRGDYEYLREISGGLGAAIIIRKLVEMYVDKFKAMDNKPNLFKMIQNGGEE